MENFIPHSSDWEETLLVHSRYAYRKSSSYLCRSARIFKLTSSPQEQKALQVLFAVMMFIDDKVDSINNEEKRKQFQGKVIRRILYSQESALFPRTINEMMVYLLENITRGRDRIDLSRTVQSLFVQSEKIREATSVKDLFRLTSEEGVLSGQLAMLFIEKTSVEFTSFVETLSKAGDTLDTLIDFKRDWELKILSVKPTLRNRFVYCLYFLRVCGSFLKHLLPRPRLFLLTGAFFFKWICRKFFPKSL